MRVVDVTAFLERVDPAELSASACELGQDAGRITWRNSMRAAENPPCEPTPELLDAIRDHFREYGAWDDDEIDAWTETECLAIFCQEIAASRRELEICEDDDGNVSPEAVENAAERGTISSRLYVDRDGRWTFHLGS